MNSMATVHSQSNLDAFHKEYGSIVRVSPSEVSFTSPEGVKDICDEGPTFPKSHFYDLF